MIPPVNHHVETRSTKVECNINSRKDECDLNVTACSPTASECMTSTLLGLLLVFPWELSVVGDQTSGLVTSDPCMLRMRTFSRH